MYAHAGFVYACSRASGRTYRLGDARRCIAAARVGPAAAAGSADDGPLLAPGIGAQGATPADLPTVFGDAVRNVVPSVSRGVLRHGPDAAALRDAAARFAEEVRTAVA